MNRLLEALALSRTRLEPRYALTLTGFALALGLIGSAVFKGTQPGVNVLLWSAALLTAFLFAARQTNARLPARQLVFLGTSLAFAGLVSLRASEMLQFLDLSGATTLLMLGIATPPGLGFRRIGFIAFSFALFVGLAALAAGAYRLLTSVRWRERFDEPSKENVVAIGRAVLVALPLLLGFGALFVAADAVFEAQLRRLTRFDFESLWSHTVWFAACGWTAAGVFWCGLAVEVPIAPQAEMPERRRLRVLETGIILGSLAALFAAFVAIQVRYLFGGEGLVQESLNLTYSEYARRGFFELVAASALLLPVLLAVNWARRRGRLSDRVYQLMALILVGLLLVVMASALQRLRIYEQAFGLTELRLYSATFLVGLGAVFLWLLWTLFRQGGNGFICGAVVAAAVTLVALNAMNPDSLIATRNTSRISSGAKFDAAHAVGLSADAVPALVWRLDLLSPEDRCLIGRTLLDRWSREQEDLRSWNWGRRQAREAVAAHRIELEAACG